MPEDFKYIDMPTMMGRIVTVQDPEEKTRWVRDESWYRQVREIYRNLLSFLSTNGLLKKAASKEIDHIIVMFSDLSEEGQILAKSGAVEKWLSSLDRPGSKKEPTDTRLLEKALNKIRDDKITLH